MYKTYVPNSIFNVTAMGFHKYRSRFFWECLNMFGWEKIWPLSVRIYKTVLLECTGDLSHRLAG